MRSSMLPLWVRHLLSTHAGLVVCPYGFALIQPRPPHRGHSFLASRPDGRSWSPRQPDDKTYCVYIAPDEAAVRAHAQKGSFQANSVVRVDPTTAEAA
jgi:hypothetical protein